MAKTQQPQQQQTSSDGWIQYPIQTRTGNYINGRYNPDTGAIQVKQDYSSEGGNDWTDIGSAPAGEQSATYSDKYGNISYPGMLPSTEQLWQMRLSRQQQPQQTSAPASPTGPSPFSYLTSTGGQTYGAPARASIPRGFNLYSPPVSGIGAMSDLAVQPPLIQPLSSTNLGQMNQNRQASSFLS